MGIYRTATPYGPTEINWAHPLAKGLKRCFVFSGRSYKDLVTGNKGLYSYPNTSKNFGFQRGGLALGGDHGGTNDNYFYDTSYSVADKLSTPDETTTILFRVNSFPSVIGNGNGVSGLYNGSFHCTLKSNGGFRVGYPLGSSWGVGLQDVGSTGLVSARDLVTVSYVMKNYSASGTLYCKDLQTVTLTAGTGGSSNQSYWQAGLSINRTYTSWLNFYFGDNTYYLFMVHKRAMSAGEVQQLQEDPYVFLRPSPDTIYTNFAAAGGGFNPAFAARTNTLIGGGFTHV